MDSICQRLEDSQRVVNYRKIINTGIIHSTILYLAYDIEEKKTVEELENPKLGEKFLKM